MLPLSEIIGGFSGFKGKALLYVGVVVLAGAVWTNGREMQRSGHVFKAPTSSFGTNWTGVGGGGKEDFFLKKGDVLGKAAVTVGLSFMVAMIAGSFLRAAFKTAVGLLLLSGVAIWFLESQGYVSLWNDYFDAVRNGGNWVTTHLDLIGEFLGKHLPSAGAALVGFGFGLRR